MLRRSSPSPWLLFTPSATTNSNNFLGTSTPTPAGVNGFVAEVDVSQSVPAVGWGLQPLIIGGAGEDTFQGIVAGASGRLYVAGTTSSTGLP